MCGWIYIYIYHILTGKRIPNEALSSPAKINASKGSTVWLHWNYTYPKGFTLEWHKAGYINDASKNTIETLAIKNGTSGEFKALSVIPAPFTGRVDAISHNNTLVIKNLQYNDTAYKFSSFVQVSYRDPRVEIPFIETKPVVDITVQGIVLKLIMTLVEGQITPKKVYEIINHKGLFCD